MDWRGVNATITASILNIARNCLLYPGQSTQNDRGNTYISVDWKWHEIQVGKLTTGDWLGKISYPLPQERLNVEEIPDRENRVHTGEVGGVSGLSPGSSYQPNGRGEWNTWSRQQHPEGGTVSSLNGTWLWLIIFWTFWRRCLSQRRFKSLCRAPIIPEQTLVILLYRFLSFTDKLYRQTCKTCRHTCAQVLVITFIHCCNIIQIQHRASFSPANRLPWQLRTWENGKTERPRWRLPLSKFFLFFAAKCFY